MKHFFITLMGCSLLAACANTDASSTKSNAEDSAKHAQLMQAASDTTNYTSIQWIDSTFQNIGKVKEGQVAEVSWKFKNTGDKPLIIVDVVPGCGCTVADKPKEPVAPGAESVIKAKFDSKGQSEGEHQKMVSVQANTKNTTFHQLSFKVDVTK